MDGIYHSFGKDIYALNQIGQAPADPETSTHTIGTDQILLHPAPASDPPKVWLQTSFIAVFDILVPTIGYYALVPFIPLLLAVLGSGLPTLLWVIFMSIYYKKVDFVGCITLISITISAFIASFLHDYRIPLILGGIPFATYSVILLITLIPFRVGTFTLRPCIFYISKSIYQNYELAFIFYPATGVTEHRFDVFWRTQPRYRYEIRAISLMWAVLSLLIFVCRMCLIMIRSPLTPFQIVICSNLIAVLITIIQVIVTLWMVRTLKVHVLEDHISRCATNRLNGMEL